MAVVHVELHSANIGDIEDNIVAELTKYIRRDKETADRLDSLLADLHLAAVRKDNSLLLYFYCESVSEMYRLTQLLESGRLKIIIEQVFSILTGTSTGLNVSVRLHDPQQFSDCYNQLLADGQLYITFVSVDIDK